MNFKEELHIRNAGLITDPYVESERSPLSVIRGTKLSFDIYFFSENKDNHGFHKFIDEYSLPMIDSAMRAIPWMNQLSHEVGSDDFDQIKSVIGKEGAPNDATSDIEALDIAHLIFVAMPEKYWSPSYTVGFSKRGVLKPPSSISGYMNRLHEVKTVVKAIREGDIAPDYNIEGNNSVLRTHAFFDVGSKLPPPSERNLKEVEVVYEASQRLLDSCEFLQ